MGVFVGVEFRPETPPVTYREVQVVSVTVYQTVPTYVTILQNQYYTWTQTETQYYPMAPPYQYYPQYYQTDTFQYIYTQTVTTTRPVRTFHTSYSTTFSHPTTFHTFTVHTSHSTTFSRPTTSYTAHSTFSRPTTFFTAHSTTSSQTTTTGINTVTVLRMTRTFTRGHGVGNATLMEAGPALSAIYANL